MKKIVVGLVVFGVFVVYSIGIRHKLDTGKLLTIGQSNQTTNNSAASNSSPSTTSSNSSLSQSNSNVHTNYKDGSYNGSSADAYYGNVQVAAAISGGKISDVKILKYPDTHSTSVSINQQALPMLVEEAIQSQSANVQVISGATFTSQAFSQSLTSALSQAQN